MNWSDITAGDLLMLDHKMVLVLKTVPQEPFYDYGLDKNYAQNFNFIKGKVEETLKINDKVK